MPEVQGLGVGALGRGILWVLVGLRLELALEEVVAVVEEELVRGLHAGLDTVLDHCGGSGRAGQLLNLKRGLYTSQTHTHTQAGIRHGGDT